MPPCKIVVERYRTWRLYAVIDHIRSKLLSYSDVTLPSRRTYHRITMTFVFVPLSINPRHDTQHVVFTSCSWPVSVAFTTIWHLACAVSLMYCTLLGGYLVCFEYLCAHASVIHVLSNAIGLWVGLFQGGLSISCPVIIMWRLGCRDSGPRYTFDSVKDGSWY